MLKRILVPLDGSAVADRSLDRTLPLLVQEDTEVTLLAVESLFDTKRAHEGAEPLRAHLEKQRDRLSREGGRALVQVIEGEDAAEEILRFAAELGPSLIVLSAHGHTGNVRSLRGSIAERILRRTEHPLLLVNTLSEAGDRHGFRRVLVPLDGTETSAKVLPMVASIARICGAEVLLLHVVEDRKTGDRTTKAEHQLSLQNRHGKELDRLPLRTITVEGKPAQAILDAVEREKPDMVAMTTHGQGKSGKWVFGSVAEQVLGHCPAPLLVYRTAGFTEGAVRTTPA